ncbi:MAG: bifunctional nuclease family protein [Candidatus Aenigmarchaeota archaeon]|nr:bifunctional nuclease family protein [Candidatus Aenigmarchaeota archaeon]
MARSRGDELGFYKIISVVAILVAVAAFARPYFSGVDAVTPLLPIEELSTSGYTKVDVQVSASENAGIVTIQGGCYQVTATTELSQVESIANGQEGRVGSRPLTHDLFKDAMESLDVVMVMVKVVDMQDNTYIGRMILKQGDRIVSLDSRPSDGIALAVRTGAPVYMKDDLLKSQGQYVC